MRTIIPTILTTTVLLTVTATCALAITDHICMERCTDRGYAYNDCLLSCSYTTEYERGLVREQYLKNKMIEQDLQERKNREEERRSALRDEAAQRAEEKLRLKEEKEQMEYERGKYNQGN